jgi:hypothetical protein
MAEWTEEFEKHTAHSRLQELDVLLSELESSEVLDAADLESLNRIRQVALFTKSVLSSVDPNLVAKDRLDGLAEYLALQVRELNQYKSTQNSSHISNRSPSDQVLNQLAGLNVPRTSEDVEGLREALTTLRRSMGQHSRLIEAEYDEIEQKFTVINKSFEELTDEIKSQKQRLDTAISQFQQQFSEAESKRRDEYSQESSNTRAELKKAVDSGQEEIDTLISTLREEFDAAEKQRKDEYKSEFESGKATLTGLLDKGKQDLSELTQQHKEAFAAVVTDTKDARTRMETDFSAKVSEYILQLERRQGEAEQLVQVIGNTGMVGIRESLIRNVSQHGFGMG